jgi:dTDP-N-acetylfucosamine:lipid II N-acetylfucosaminyltransferase
MNLHLTGDDKFLSNFIANEKEHTNSENLYFIFAANKNIKHTNLSQSNVIAVDFFVEDVINQIKAHEIKKIFLHGLHEIFLPIIDLVKKDDVKVYWIFFGIEVFKLPSIEEKLYLNQTKKYILQNSNKYLRFSLNPIQLRRNIINYYGNKKKSKNWESTLMQIIAQVDYFCHFIKEDFDKYIQPLNPQIKFIEWSYYRPFLIDHKVKSSSKETKKLNVLLGNSASIFNNHLNALDDIYNKFGSDINLYVPLSYAGSDKYINEVCSKGKLLFNQNFNPLLSFMDKKEYFEFMSKIDFAVYYNIRSQAGGNIFWLINNSKAIIMNRESTMMSFLTRIGIKIYAMDSFLYTKELFDKKVLTNNYIEFNDFFSSQRQKERYQLILC